MEYDRKLINSIAKILHSEQEEAIGRIVDPLLIELKIDPDSILVTTLTKSLRKELGQVHARTLLRLSNSLGINPLTREQIDEVLNPAD